ncbi:MAG: hypothetical protein ABR878_07775 [Roseiarcus sp.]|jgi:hypothetical protein
MRETLAAYEKLRSADPSGWPELTIVKVRASGPEMLDANEAERRLAEVQYGWARHRSGARRLNQPAGAEFGPPLFAEWVEARGKASFRLAPHPDEPGLLALWRYAEEEGENAIEALAQDVAVLERGLDIPTESETAPLVLYRVYWGAPSDDSSALRRLFARFMGFEERSEFAGRPIVVRPSDMRNAS